MIRNLRTVLPALLVPFFKEVVLEPLDAFHLSKKFVGRVVVVQVGRDLFFGFTSKNQPCAGRIAEDFDDNFKVPMSHWAVMRFPLR
jgi:hypothetical protein